MNLITSDDETTHTVLIRSHLKNAEESDTESLKMHSSYFRMLQGVSARELGWRWLRQGGPFCCVCVISPELLCVAACSLLIRTLRALCWVVNVVTSRHPPAVSVGGASFRWSLQQNHRYPREMLTDEGKGLKHSRLPGLDKSCSGGSTGL